MNTQFELPEINKIIINVFQFFSIVLSAQFKINILFANIGTAE